MAAATKRQPYVLPTGGPPIWPRPAAPMLMPDTPAPELALTPEGDVTRNITPAEAQSLSRVFLPGPPSGPRPVDPDEALAAAGQQLEAEQAPSSPMPKGMAAGPPQGFPAGSEAPGTLVYPKPAGKAHPILSAIKRGFQAAMPLVGGAMEGLAAGGREPSAPVAMAKGFQAAEMAPYHRAKALTDIASRVQDIQLKKQHGALYEAQAPGVEERLQIQRDTNDIRRYSVDVRNRLGEEKQKVAKQLADLKSYMSPQDYEKRVADTALARVKADLTTQYIKAGYAPARVAMLNAQIDELDKRGYLEEVRAEEVADTAEAQRKLMGARTGEAEALAGSARALAEQRRSGNVGPRGQARSAILNNYHMRQMQIINGVTDEEVRQQMLEDLRRDFAPYLEGQGTFGPTPTTPAAPKNPYR